jgi:hypothetical protein
MAQLLNQTIKELRSLEPQELAAVHGMIRFLRIASLIKDHVYE